MGNPYLANASAYLVETVFGLYILLVLLRFLLQLARADFYNPFCQFLVKATNPPLRPLRRVIPGLWRIDLAAIVLMLVLQIASIWLVNVAEGRTIAFEGLLILAVAELFALILNFYLITILIQVIVSWVGPGSYNPLLALVYSLNEPVLAPARRVLPTTSGMDFSPLLVLVAIQLLKILVVGPLNDVGRAFAFG